VLPAYYVVVLPDPFRGMGAWRNSTETQQSGHAPRSGPEVKSGRSGAEDGASDADSQGGGESDPAEGIRRHCMKNFPSVLTNYVAKYLSIVIGLTTCSFMLLLNFASFIYLQPIKD